MYGTVADFLRDKIQDGSSRNRLWKVNILPGGSLLQIDERPKRPDLPERADLVQTSCRFSLKFLLGVMNSTVAGDFLKANRCHNIHIYPDDWKQLPIPDVLPEQQAPMVALVDEILDVKRAGLDEKVSTLEDKLDGLVSRLYGL